MAVTCAQVMAEYHQLNPVDLAFLNSYHQLHQQMGLRNDGTALNYGEVAVQRQWQGYAAIKNILDGITLTICDSMIPNLLASRPDPALPTTDITGLYCRADNWTALNEDPYFSIGPARNGRKHRWTGIPKHRMNLP
jgi:hypothetical protein